MTNTKTTKSPNVYDTRVIQRNVGDGTLSEAEVKKHIETLPDVAQKAEPFETSLRGNDRDDEDDDQDEG
jgi:hypothetical protein